MKKIFAAIAVTALLLTGQAFAGVEIGKPAPDFTFKDVMGMEHKVSDFKGRILVLEWTNPECPFVHKFYDKGDMPRIQALAKATPDVAWIAINSSGEKKEGHFASDEEAKKSLEKVKFAGDAYVRDPSGEFGKAYGAKTTPHMFVIDKEGNVAYAGAIDSIKSADSEDIAKADNYVLKAIEALVKGEKPAVASTDAYGCGVKYKN
jgi:peroxiredoxin